MKPWIYISHRSAAAEEAERLKTALQRQLGAVGFTLTQHAPSDATERGLALIRIACSTHFIALIDPEWNPEAGNDELTEEISLAFDAGMAVFPVLLGQPRIAAEDRLPESIRKLASCTPFEVRDDHWVEDLAQLAQSMLPMRNPNAPDIGFDEEPLPPSPNEMRAPSQRERQSGMSPRVEQRAVAWARGAFRAAGKAVDEGNLDRAMAILREVRLEAAELREQREELKRQIEAYPAYLAGMTRCPAGKPEASAPNRPKSVAETMARVRTTTAADIVKCSVFAPPTTKAGESILIQVFAHLRSDDEMVKTLAETFDAWATHRAAKVLDQEVERGTALAISLSFPGIAVDEPTQLFVWRGEPEVVQFACNIPPDHREGRLIGTVFLSQNSVPFGNLKFILDIAAPSVVAAAAQPSSPDQAWTRYRHAFISYASVDRVEVLKRVQMLDRTGIYYFEDLLSLDPGERWERSLYKEIDESDVVFLFWSTAAKNSEWVMKEVRYAIERRAGDEMAPPAIVPVMIEGPPPVAPPPELKDLHFNDRFLYFLAGSA